MQARRERRAHRRIPCQMLATLEHGQATWSGFVRDYSEGGLYVSCHAPVRPGDPVVVWLERPADGAVVELPAVVCRVVAPGEQGAQGVGLRLGHVLSDAAALARVDPVGGA